MRKVLIVTYYWPPSGGAGVQRWLKFTKYLPELGYEPYIVTVDPDHASYPVRDNSLMKDIHPAVKVFHTRSREPFAFYKLFSRKKQIPFAGFANEGKERFSQKIFRFIRGNFFIPDARKGWNKFALQKCEELINKEKIELIVTSSPPHSSQLIGLELKKKYPHMRWVADLRDPWTDIYYYDKLLHTPIAKAIDSSYERKVIENCDAAIVVSEFIRDQFSQKTTKPVKEKIAVIPNGYDQKDFDDVVAKVSPFLITYTGTLSTDYPVEDFIEAVKKLNDTQIRIRFVGSVPQVVKNKFEGLPVEFIAHVDHQKAIAFMKESNALLLMIPSAKDNKGILTGKLFEYIASGTPILCIGPTDGDAVRIIEECKAGVSCDAGDPDEVLKAIKALRDYQIPDSKLREQYSRKNLTSKLARLL
jgi:glycosyltransferase involved in cell wall biosynthesis